MTESKLKNRKITIICSAGDPASQNIMKGLLSMYNWNQIDRKIDGFSKVFEHGNFRIVEIESHHIYQDGIDRKLISFGLDPLMIIFASRHSSRDGRKLLTAHISGNTAEAELGGRSREVAMAAPVAMRNILRSMRELSKEIDYDVSMESTHHGPTDICTPSLYAEIGSTSIQWTDPVAGRIVASSILSLDNPLQEEVPVAIGFGGGHYSARQSMLIFNADIAFGHSFPNYQLSGMDAEIIQHAIERTDPDFAYFDRKAMPSEERSRIEKIINQLGLEVIRESEIQQIKGISWSTYSEIRSTVNRIYPGATPVISRCLQEFLSSSKCTCNTSIRSTELSRDLIQEVDSVDRNCLKDFFEEYPLIYAEKTDGTLANRIFSIQGDGILQDAAGKYIDKCIQILKKHYEIEYNFDDNILYIKKNRFSPQLAREQGVSPGPMFGKLANGQNVRINGKTIKPEMVYQSYKKEIKL
ncbi:D-aminoacyl-tRNA deacylase [Methanosalsum zhilinae]|nr:D-aminoacyl-tRNA deacylase [Methanosalsum zhilinae]